MSTQRIACECVFSQMVQNKLPTKSLDMYIICRVANTFNFDCVVIRTFCVAWTTELRRRCHHLLVSVHALRWLFLWVPKYISSALQMVGFEVFIPPLPVLVLGTFNSPFPCSKELAPPLVTPSSDARMYCLIFSKDFQIVILWFRARCVLLYIQFVLMNFSE